ncbi:hypothetical protein ACTA71_011702 [Dictyostelium dimigraforme]
MDSYNFKWEDWEIDIKLKESVYKVNNKKNVILNGYSFETCILKVVKNKGKGLCSEVQALEKLKDVENMVKCYGFSIDENFTYIFIEYINGYTLGHYVSKNSPIPENELSVIIEDLIKALISIHEKDVIHRDLKLENVMFDSKCNKWKLIDFSHSFNISQTEKDGSKRFTECGTIDYYPPEMKIRNQQSCRKSDVWLLGCLVIEMLNGKLEEPNDIDGADDNKKVWIPKIPQHASKFLQNFIQKCFFEKAILRFDSKTLLSHPFLSINKGRSDILSVIQKGHKNWMEVTQKKKGIIVGDKTFIFQDNDNTEPFTVDSVPDGTIELIFKKTFNKPIPMGSIPGSVKIIIFGVDGDSLFNQELEQDVLPTDELKSLTLGNAFTYPIPYFSSLCFLSLGRNRRSLNDLPNHLETLKYYGEVQINLTEKSIPHVKNLLIPFNNHPIIIDTIPPTVKYLAWGKLKDLEAVETLKNLPPSVNDLTFSCPPEIFNQIQRKHIPDSISIVIINQHVIELKNSDTPETYLKDNIVK